MNEAKERKGQLFQMLLTSKVRYTRLKTIRFDTAEVRGGYPGLCGMGSRENGKEREDS